MATPHHIPRPRRKRGAPADDAQGATILHLPSPEVLRALGTIAEVGRAAIAAYAAGDAGGYARAAARHEELAHAIDGGPALRRLRIRLADLRDLAASAARDPELRAQIPRWRAALETELAAEVAA